MRDWLYDLRESKGYTQAEMASKLQMTQPAYSRLESGLGYKDMSLAQAVAISKVLNLPLGLIKELELGNDAC